MINFNKHLFTTKYFLLASLILIPLCFVLPVECSFENHFLENLEVVVLFVGFVSVIFKAKNLTKFKHFYYGCSRLYLIMIARELSWGRVFYPIGFRNNGEEIYMSIHNIWYGPVVYPVVAIVAIIALALIIKCCFDCRQKSIILDIPILYLIFFALLMMISQMVFEKSLISLLTPYSQLLEEATEAIAYCSLICFTHNWRFKTTTRRNFYVNFF